MHNQSGVRGEMICGVLMATKPITKGEQVLWDYGKEFAAVVAGMVGRGTSGSAIGGRPKRTGPGRPRVRVAAGYAPQATCVQLKLHAYN